MSEQEMCSETISSITRINISTTGNGAQSGSCLVESGKVKRPILLFEISPKLSYQKPNIHIFLIFLIQEHCFGLKCVPSIK